MLFANQELASKDIHCIDDQPLQHTSGLLGICAKRLLQRERSWRSSKKFTQQHLDGSTLFLDWFNLDLDDLRITGEQIAQVQDSYCQ
jgi:hypothetical protein